MKLIAIYPSQSAEERYCLDSIHRLRLDFEKAAKPYIDKLVAIRCEQLPKYVLTPDDTPGTPL